MSLDLHKKPFGYRFKPTDNEIVQTLIEFVNGVINVDELSRRSILVQNVYDCEPWTLDWTPKEGMSDNVRYFLGQRKKASGKPNEMRACRRIGKGELHWKNKGARVEICGGRAIVTKLILVTEGRGEGTCSTTKMECKIKWSMLEYVLQSESFQHFALCKIKRQPLASNDNEDQILMEEPSSTSNVDRQENAIRKDTEETIYKDLMPIMELDHRFGTLRY